MVRPWTNGWTKQALRSRMILRILKSVPCHDCGGYFGPDIMDFDHRNPSKKINAVASMTPNPKKMLEEYAKCDTVCPNCHRLRTIRRRNS